MQREQQRKPTRGLYVRAPAGAGDLQQAISEAAPPDLFHRVHGVRKQKTEGQDLPALVSTPISGGG